MKRRAFLKTLAAGAAWAVWRSAAGEAAGAKAEEAGAAAAGAARRPNIVVFIVDDMGWQDTSEPFWTQATPLNRKYHTPNMERLAREGMKFTQAYACPVCSPTRVSLMTGLNAARHRVTNWTLQKDKPPDASHPILRPPDWNYNGLCPEAGLPHSVHATPLPAFLRQAGYRTIHVGKAHWGARGTPGADPLRLGFDVNIAGHAAGAPGHYLGTKNFGRTGKADDVWGVPGLDKYHGQDIFLSEALTREAKAAVSEAVSAGKPFYLYMSHYAVHVPFAPDARFIERYRQAGLDQKEAMYAALIEGMDKSLGDILDHLAALGVADNTAVLFVSDNGGLSVHGRGGPPNTHNLPLSSGKGSAREGGIRVPMLARWPGVIKAGSTSGQFVMIEDFFPTIVEIAGVRDAKQVGGAIDGISFVPLLKGGQGPADRALVWHYPNNWGPTGPGIGAFSAIRQGDWKYIYYHDGRGEELFNLADDIGETKNLAGEKPDIRSRLARTLGQYLTSVNAQTPINKKTGQPVAVPAE